jgi:hypothetical protein
MKGSHAVRDLAEDWRFSGGLVPEEAPDHGRREAYNIMLSMPRGADPLAVQRAAREFARVELAGHKYVMVLHDHQANPHVHISVRAEGRGGQRLNPRKADLHRWRELFAEKLRDLGVDAEATRRPTRGATRTYDQLWKLKARESGRLRNPTSPVKNAPAGWPRHDAAAEAWRHLRSALGSSPHIADQQLAVGIAGMLEKLSKNVSIDAPVQRVGPMTTRIPTPERS